jgi:transposase
MEQWTLIRYLHAQGKVIREIARDVGVSRQPVRRALAAEGRRATHGDRHAGQSWSRTGGW